MTTHHHANVRGKKIFYREAGSKDSPTVVLLHGFPSSSHMFRDLIPQLSDKFHVIAPDYVGFGYSDAPSVQEFEYTFDNLAAHVEDLLFKNLGLKQFSIYVQDYGAPVGYRIASKHPDAIQSIVVQNGNAYEEAVPVSDVERALRFYVDQVGFTLDVDYWPNDAFRVVQLTPPGSSCSIQIGNGLTDAPVGSLRNVYLVVTDLEAVRSRLLERGVEVGEIRHKTPIGAWDGGFAPGLDPARGDYASFVNFSDPDGNNWVPQEGGYRNV